MMNIYSGSTIFVFSYEILLSLTSISDNHIIIIYYRTVQTSRNTLQLFKVLRLSIQLLK